MTSIIQSIAKEFSLNKIYNILKQKVRVSKNTVYQYFDYLKEIFFAFSLHKFDFSEKRSMLTIPKVYVIDNGLTGFEGFSQDIGRRMENAVFLELKKQELSDKIRLFYWKNAQQWEVDFVVVKDEKVNQLIQVTYASTREEISSREIRSLLKAGKELDCRDLLVITWDYEGEEEIKGEKIRFLPLWKWLVGF